MQITNPFKTKPQDMYKDQPDNPWLKAKQQWDMRLGSARVQAFNWRILSFGLIFLCVTLTFGLIHLGSESKIVPFLIRTNKLGQTQVIKLDANNFKVDPNEAAYFIAQFVRLTRELSNDPVVLKKNWLTAYDFVSSKAKKILNQYAKSHDPFQLMNKILRSVEIISVLYPSKDSVELKWKEETFSKDGALTDTGYYSGLFTYEIKLPSSVKDILKNPLGVYITSFTWSKTLNPSDNK